MLMVRKWKREKMRLVRELLQIWILRKHSSLRTGRHAQRVNFALTSTGQWEKWGTSRCGRADHQSLYALARKNGLTASQKGSNAEATSQVTMFPMEHAATAALHAGRTHSSQVITTGLLASRRPESRAEHFC